MIKKHITTVIFLSIAMGQLMGSSYVAEFAELGFSVRSSALGGAAVASGGAQSLLMSPVIPQSSAPEGYLMHSMLYGSMYKLDVAAIDYPLWQGTAAFQIIRLATDGIPFTRADGFYDWGADGVPGTGDVGEGNGIKDPGEPVRPDAVDLKSEGDYLGAIGYSFPIGKRLTLGVSGKFLHQGIGNYSANGFGFDAAMNYRHSSGLSATVTVRDITGAHLKWSTGTNETKLPLLLVGVSYPTYEWRWLGVNTYSEIETRFEGAADARVKTGALSLDPHIGAEAVLFDRVSLRLGLDRKFITTGAGISAGPIMAEYAFLGGELGNSHRIGITVALPKPTPKNEIKEIVETKPIVKTTQNQKEKAITLPEEKPTPSEDKTILKQETAPIPGEIIGIVQFELGSAVLSEEGKVTLRNVMQTMRKFPQIRVRIEGHTDKIPIHTAEFANNYALSEGRAAAAKDFLTSLGISPERITTKGYGPDKPRYPEGFKNRRVEIVITRSE